MCACAYSSCLDLWPQPKQQLPSCPQHNLTSSAKDQNNPKFMIHGSKIGYWSRHYGHCGTTPPRLPTQDHPPAFGTHSSIPQ